MSGRWLEGCILEDAAFSFYRDLRFEDRRKQRFFAFGSE